MWKDLRKYSQIWRKVLISAHCVFELGASEAIYSNIMRNIIHEKCSPIVFMRARKNEAERDGMHRAHVIDGAAMCDALSLLESRVSIFFCFIQ